MDCKRVMELMTQFINERLDDEDVQAFLEHIDSCPECREELEVNYSLMTAMKQLDEDVDLSDDYIGELNQKIETCYLDELKRKRACIRRRIVLGLVIVLLILQSGITMRETRKDEDQRFFRMITGEEAIEKGNVEEIEDEPCEDREVSSEGGDKE